MAKNLRNLGSKVPLAKVPALTKLPAMSPARAAAIAHFALTGVVPAGAPPAFANLKHWWTPSTEGMTDNVGDADAVIVTDDGAPAPSFAGGLLTLTTNADGAWTGPGSSVEGTVAEAQGSALTAVVACRIDTSVNTQEIPLFAVGIKLGRPRVQVFAVVTLTAGETPKVQVGYWVYPGDGGTADRWLTWVDAPEGALRTAYDNTRLIEVSCDAAGGASGVRIFVDGVELEDLRKAVDAGQFPWDYTDSVDVTWGRETDGHTGTAIVGTTLLYDRALTDAERADLVAWYQTTGGYADIGANVEPALVPVPAPVPPMDAPGFTSDTAPHYAALSYPDASSQSLTDRTGGALSLAPMGTVTYDAASNMLATGADGSLQDTGDHLAGVGAGAQTLEWILKIDEASLATRELAGLWSNDAFNVSYGPPLRLQISGGSGATVQMALAMRFAGSSRVSGQYMPSVPVGVPFLLQMVLPPSGKKRDIRTYINGSRARLVTAVVAGNATNLAGTAFRAYLGRAQEADGGTTTPGVSIGLLASYSAMLTKAQLDANRAYYQTVFPTLDRSAVEAGPWDAPGLTSATSPRYSCMVYPATYSSFWSGDLVDFADTEAVMNMLHNGDMGYSAASNTWKNTTTGYLSSAGMGSGARPLGNVAQTYEFIVSKATVASQWIAGIHADADTGAPSLRIGIVNGGWTVALKNAANTTNQRSAPFAPVADQPALIQIVIPGGSAPASFYVDGVLAANDLPNDGLPATSQLVAFAGKTKLVDSTAVAGVGFGLFTQYAAALTKAQLDENRAYYRTKFPTLP